MHLLGVGDPGLDLPRGKASTDPPSPNLPPHGEKPMIRCILLSRSPAFEQKHLILLLRPSSEYPRSKCDAAPRRVSGKWGRRTGLSPPHRQHPCDEAHAGWASGSLRRRCRKLPSARPPSQSGGRHGCGVARDRPRRGPHPCQAQTSSCACRLGAFRPFPENDPLQSQTLFGFLPWLPPPQIGVCPRGRLRSGERVLGVAPLREEVPTGARCAPWCARHRKT